MKNIFMNFTYAVQFSRRKSIAISISEDGNVVVRSPKGISGITIRAFLKQKELWITKHLLRIHRAASSLREGYSEGSRFLLLGKELRFVIAENGTLRSDQKNLYFPAYDMTNVRSRVEYWYVRQAEKIIIPRVATFTPTIAKPKIIKINRARRQWGSCNNRKKEIHFSWRLVMAPIWVIDYVIVHELAHLIVSSHSPKFWSLVESACPRYQYAKQWLSQHQYRMRLPQ